MFTFIRKSSVSHCLKITHNVAFEFLNFGIFHQFFVLFKSTYLVTLFDRKLQVFKNSPIWTIYKKIKNNFCPLKM